jgi:isoleucyl-tRNA synthetase
LSNISDFTDINEDPSNYEEIDLLILNDLKDNLSKIDKAYKNFEFNVVIETINNSVLNLSS